MERTKPGMILSAGLWVCVLQNAALSASVITPDGKEHGPVVEMQSIPDAVRDMGPIRLLFYVAVLMIVLGGVWFLFRFLRHRQNLLRGRCRSRPSDP